MVEVEFSRKKSERVKLLNFNPADLILGNEITFISITVYRGSCWAFNATFHIWVLDVISCLFYAMKMTPSTKILKEA